MVKTYDGPWVLRTLLFAPGHVEKLISKAAASEADCVVLDLEDAVPAFCKADARQLIRNTLVNGTYAHRTVFVRINPIDTGLTLLDLAEVACRELHGFVYPMAYEADDVKSFDAQLRLTENTLGLPVGHFSLIILMETPLAIVNAYSIAKASDRIVGLLFGCEDYFADMQANHNWSDASLHTPRAQVAIAARAAGVEPIDTPYIKVYDLEGLRDFANYARNQGMAGMLVMTPRQIPIAHEVYSPDQKEVEFAQRVVEAAAQAEGVNRSIAVIDGMFISPPTVRAARHLLARHNAIQRLRASRS